MDIQIRFWNENLSEVQTRYLTSKFFKRLNADNILQELLEAIDLLCQKSMIMLFMDRPKINGKVYGNFTILRKNFPELLITFVAWSLSDWHESQWLKYWKKF